MNNAFKDGQLLEFNNNKNFTAVIFYLFIIATSLTLLTFNILSDEGSIINYLYGLGIIGGVLSIVFSSKNTNLLFGVNAAIVFFIIVGSKFFSSVQSTAYYISILVEVALSLSLILYFNYKRSLIVPAVFIILHLVESVVTEKVQLSDSQTLNDANSIQITSLAILVLLFVFSFSAFFIYRLRFLYSYLLNLIGDFDKKEVEIDQNHVELVSVFKKIHSQSITQSHKLRAPITRIEGLLSIHEASLDMDEDERASLQTELNKSLAELRVELEILERALCDAKAIIAKS